MRHDEAFIVPEPPLERTDIDSDVKGDGATIGISVHFGGTVAIILGWQEQA